MNSLATLSLKELKELSGKVKGEIAARTIRATLRNELKAMGAACGSSLEAVAGGAWSRNSGMRSATKKTVAVKYMHPSNRKLVWSGRGSRPAWVKSWCERGGSFDALANVAQKLGQGMNSD